MKSYDVIIVGAGAAGLMCAMEAGKRKRSVLILDHANKPGKKILMSGGGRCNFTNYDVTPEKFISHNPRFCVSALSRYSQWDFIALVEKYGIAYHEKTQGQLFCDRGAKDILNMLLAECKSNDVTIQLNSDIEKVEKTAEKSFRVMSNQGTYECTSLVVATGGLSIPKMSASPFGYRIAEQFNIDVQPTKAGLVPFTLKNKDKEKLSPLSGVSVPAQVSIPGQSFCENILFTHRGLSGPAVLQISSYWQPGEEININLLPGNELMEKFKTLQRQHPKQKLKSILNKSLPKRLVGALFEEAQLNQVMQGISRKQLETISKVLQEFRIKPNGTEGYRTAEVTVGGVDCDSISSKTMESHQVKGLFFIGEVLDVTGWLGGLNFQWAWSSGWCAGQYA
ncbi:MAG: NAD(P)/FAD-dependent oxidoreductase [Gammaproteobacteria bacterium]